ncbi:MAG: HDOD domain-containing protein [Marinobacterium sp.]|nr:HDOD domain-containing protein [Marinobacterium sp.]
MHIEDLLSQTHRLPNVPQAVRLLIQQLNNPDADYNRIAAKVGEDQTLSIQVLRTVNSAQFGLNRKIASIEEAVVIMGMERLKTLVIASGLASSVREIDGLDLGRFWNESFRVAIVSQYLGERSSRVEPDIAFTAGVIHNTGRLLLHLAAPEQAMSIQRQLDNSMDLDRYQLEQKTLGFTSLEAGKALMDLWEFPPILGEAILQHRRPLDWSDGLPLAAIVHLATIVNVAARDGWTLRKLFSSLPLDVIARAGLEKTIREKVDVMLELEFTCDLI